MIEVRIQVIALSQTGDQKRFKISEVVASEQLDPLCSQQTYHRPNQPY